MAKYLELLRVRSVKKPRIDWPDRWSAAVEAAKRKGLIVVPGHEERMVAEEKSPIWRKLAEGAGDFRDAIGEGEPPFAYGSGMGWKQMKSSPKEVEPEIESTIRKKLASQDFKEELKSKLRLVNLPAKMEMKVRFNLH